MAWLSCYAQSPSSCGIEILSNLGKWDPRGMVCLTFLGLLAIEFPREKGVLIRFRRVTLERVRDANALAEQIVSK